jgi:hypothetical protein
MKKNPAFAPFALLLLASPALWSQDLAEAARAARERAKATKHVITNEGADQPPAAPSESASWSDALQNMRYVFRDVCADPQTKKGKMFTDAQMNTMRDAAKPLRDRDAQLAAKEKEFNARFAQLDREQEQAITALIGNRAPSEEERKQIDAINQEYDVRRKALRTQAEDFLAGAAKIRQEIGATAEECPEAAKRI